MRTLELLAPAKNLECGIVAIDHGADAVYIGAPRFGARAAAGNSLDDIRQLCDYAHQFGAKVHVTVNTIIYNSELEDTLQMIHGLKEVGVDALLLQDMGVMDAVKSFWTKELHSSTQCDTRSVEKVKWLQSLGFNRAVLARELSVQEIADIHEAVPDMDLEVFVHGALCVSYSGVCYASQYCFQRSANRGECAQFCRLKFDLKDDNGREIEHQRHLLSLKDMCQIDNLADLAQAGACSFKIEGRLKDVSYVKNVVSAYSQRLNEIVARFPKVYRRASQGVVDYHFEPNLKKTFNRGFTTYFFNGRQPDIASFDTPKAIGEYVGKVKEIRGNSFNVAGTASFANGDGLCFINDEHELEGFRVNRAEGNRLFPLKMPQHLRSGLGLYRNNDVAFEKILAGKTAERKMPIEIVFRPVKDGFEALSGKAKVFVPFEHQEARKPQDENIIRQLSKLGNTPYICSRVIIEDDGGNYFVPSSLLSELRRLLVEKIQVEQVCLDKNTTVASHNNQEELKIQPWQPSYEKFPYLYNISNKRAGAFYEHHGMVHPAPAFELGFSSQGHIEPLIMQCRHCIRYSLGFCVKRGGKKPNWKEPLHLELPDGRSFRLEFACKECQMNIYAE